MPPSQPFSRSPFPMSSLETEAEGINAEGLSITTENALFLSILTPAPGKDTHMVIMIPELVAKPA